MDFTGPKMYRFEGARRYKTGISKSGWTSGGKIPDEPTHQTTSRSPDGLHGTQNVPVRGRTAVQNRYIEVRMDFSVNTPTIVHFGWHRAMRAKHGESGFIGWSSCLCIGKRKANNVIGRGHVAIRKKYRTAIHKTDDICLCSLFSHAEIPVGVWQNSSGSWLDR